MKKTLTIMTALLVLLFSSSCVRENLPAPSGLGEGEGWLIMNFGAEDNLEISTKATLGPDSESRVLNLFIFLFDRNGNKLYSKWFESSDMVYTAAEVESAGKECWHVSNPSASAAATGTTAKGTVKFKAPLGENLKLYAIANLDADMVRISSDFLSHNINSESELLNFHIYLNQETVSRNGYFPMTGMRDGITITTDNTSSINTAANPLRLRRLDAKIRFIFKTGTRADENNQKIKSFTARQWRVINVPQTSFLIEKTSDSGDVPPTTDENSYSDYASKFFDTDWVNFEDFPDTETSEFSFYMMENRMSPKNTAFTSYNERSRQQKEGAGLPHEGQNRKVTVNYINSKGADVTRDMRIFSNANDFSTYVLVTGRVDMDLQNDDAGQTLGGDVQYLIHLGNWSRTSAGTHWNDDVYKNFTDFNTLRNTSYTYTVTVNSVNNIRVEVETAGGGDVENQPGGTGHITIAKEEIAICDAHYVSKTMTFRAKNFFDGSGKNIADELTWSVKTPFSDGKPDNPELPGTLDYEWVHFRLNKKDAAGNYFEVKRRKYTDRVFLTSTDNRTAEQNAEGDGSPGLAGYHNDGAMTIVELVKYIKEQAKLYEQYKQNPGSVNQSAFDNPDDFDKAKICVTAFVDEFYYDVNPVTGVSSPTLWKSFVNQPDRSMHILCNSTESKDGESSATGSVITIQQHSIQSIYNTDLDYDELQTAWGLEYVDEFADKITSYNVSAGDYNGSGLNSDSYNGLSNSIYEWGLNNDNGNGGGSSMTVKSGVDWGDYMDFEVDNDTPQMNAAKKSLRYFCMARNRDNNGDGKIDRSELRWYTASIKQLVGLYVGNSLIDPHSRLYYRSKAEQKSDDPKIWRQHTISSTRNKGGDNPNQPTVIWGEEGTSLGDISGSIKWGTYGTYSFNTFSVRCVRNLGMAADHALSEVPEDYITVSPDPAGNTDKDARFTFVCTHLNNAALRYYTSRELDYHDQTSEMNRLYKSFQVASKKESKSFVAEDFPTFNSNVTYYINTGSSNRYCPEGYRIPNQLELTMMKLYLEGVGNGNALENSFSRTYWSFGVVPGIDKDRGDKYGYAYGGSNIYLVNKTHSTGTTRCVRDIRVN